MTLTKNLDSALEKARHIKLAVFDVDGVLTDGKIYFTSDGVEYKAFHSHDGLGLKLLLKAGIEVAIITARTSTLVQQRMDELGVRHVYQGQENKLDAYEHLKKSLQFSDHQIAYTGDDLIDVGPIRRCGLGIAVANASAFVHQHADWSTTRSGGLGAAREVCEFILAAQDALDTICEQYL
jgi:3-deoxy-D-manno-octulosonate 8-phosphate phosphatase (KDO 8-P phosphatase)